MYVPPQFREDDGVRLRALMQASPFATLVSGGPDGLVASHVPMLFDAEPEPHGTLVCHVARANPHWKIAAASEALVIFHGPDAYISPEWYERKDLTGDVVPTWNYVAVHAYGTPEIIEGPDELRAIVARLTHVHEAARPVPWSIDDAPSPYIEGQLRAIVGLRIPIARVIGKRKLSQNISASERARVIAGLMGETLT